MKTVVIGAGHISRQHLACLNRLPRVSVEAVCDLSPALAESAAEQFDVPHWYVDHRRMLEDIRPDVVHVGTPPATHFALASDALEAGAHVFVEKPITTRLEDLETLKKLAEDRDRLLIEDHNYLFNDTVRRIQGWVADGSLGRVSHVEVLICLDILAEGSNMIDPNCPHPSLKLPGGAIAEFLTHMAYLADAFVGEHHTVRTFWNKVTEDSPLPSDEMRAMIDAEHGTASLSFSSHTGPECFLLRVHGSRMRADAHLFEPRLVREQLLGGPRPLLPLRNGLLRSRDELAGAFKSIWRKLAGGPGAYEGQWELLHRTYAALEEGSAPPIPIERIEAVNRLVHALTDRSNEA